MKIALGQARGYRLLGSGMGNKGKIKNIILVGFMGSGKTVVGRALAGDLRWNYIDSDDMIEAKEGRLINNIFDEEGEEYFRRVEEEVLEKICRSRKQVIATGGGAVTRKRNQDNFKRNGVTVYLYTDKDVIWQRVKEQSQRPLLKVEDPQAKIEELLGKRESFYRSSDIIVDTSQLAVKEVVGQIKNKLKDRFLQYRKVHK